LIIEFQRGTDLLQPILQSDQPGHFLVRQDSLRAGLTSVTNWFDIQHIAKPDALTLMSLKLFKNAAQTINFCQVGFYFTAKSSELVKHLHVPSHQSNVPLCFHHFSPIVLCFRLLRIGVIRSILNATTSFVFQSNFLEMKGRYVVFVAELLVYDSFLFFS
jgi:hypothetical protein